MRELVVVPTDMLRRGACWLFALALIAGCAPAGRLDAGSRVSPSGPTGRIVAVAQGEPDFFTGAKIPGGDALQDLVHAGLAIVDTEGKLRPQLAEAVPSTENGLWTLFPDGRMETRWKLRSGARWHDGTPLTTADLTFTYRVIRDREVALPRDPGIDLIDSLDVRDSDTLVVGWSKPFIGADALFSRGLAPPLPQHVLESSYASDKAGFGDLAYWSQEFVGAGPYRIREWVRGAQLKLAANESYVLGVPKTAVIEVRFILDGNVLAANFLTGAADVTLGRSVSLDQAVAIREQWQGGRVEISYQSWIVMYPQFLSPNPGVVADVRLRRALMHALDRQEMADTLQAGVVPVAHVFLGPKEPEYPTILSRAVKYDYDPRRAAQLIESLGYARGADALLRDASGQLLTLEVRAGGGLDIQPKSLFAVADYWQRLGLSLETVIVPAQRLLDLEYRHTFPAFYLYRQGNDLGYLKRLHGAQAALLENNYRGVNYSRYRNPEFDRLLDAYFSTIPEGERLAILGDIVHHVSDQLNVMGLFYDTEPTLISNRVRNVAARIQSSTQAWNAHDWTLAPS